MKLRKDHWPYVVGFAAVVSVAFTAGVMILQAATADAVRRNEELLRQKAFVQLFHLGNPADMTAAEIAQLVEKRVVNAGEIADPETGRKIPLLKAYGDDAHKQLIAYAFKVSGIGFWDRISGWMAVTPNLKYISGIVFLQQSETPGLGGEIVKPWFRDQFDLRRPRDDSLRATPPKAGGRFLYIGGPEPTGPNDPRYHRRVDAITGATRTSVAVEKFINQRLAEFRRAAVAADLTTGGR